MCLNGRKTTFKVKNIKRIQAPVTKPPVVPVTVRPTSMPDVTSIPTVPGNIMLSSLGSFSEEYEWFDPFEWWEIY